MPEQPKSLLDLRSDFDQGVSIAMDPVNNAAIHTGGQGITNLNSYWLHQYCPVCSHTFRLGDKVEVGDDGTVRHNSALLCCSQTDVVVVHQKHNKQILTYLLSRSKVEMM
jgi:hypothetical protein